MLLLTLNVTIFDEIASGTIKERVVIAKMPDRSMEYHPQTPQQYYAQLEEDNSAMMPVIY